MSRAWGMNVLGSAKRGVDKPCSLYVPFERVLEQSDVIALHCPLTEQKRHMIDDAEFSLMRRKPLLINTARGGLVNELALGRALRAGQVAGAGFDVATSEPPNADHPLIDLLTLPNFILRSEERRVGKECVSTCRSRWSPYN